mmetsp:Transcript_100461/g.139661  ORF Transcript_100461/g.139661 Transcript_100461/m.139661 type:complete len:130 (-) Transcript_100461:57-446(-)
MFKSCLLVIICTCLRMPSAVRQQLHAAGTARVHGGRYLDEQNSRYNPDYPTEDPAHIQNIIDKCGGETKTTCIRKELEKYTPYFTKWDVTYTTNLLQYNRYYPVFMERSTRLMFHFGFLDQSTLFISCL